MKLNTYKEEDEFPDDLMRSKIDEFSETIKAQMSEVEPVFLQLGQDMQNIYSDSACLTDIITKSADIVGNQSKGSFINHIHNIVSDLLKELKNCHETVSVNKIHMDSSTGELETLCKICTSLAKTARFLNVVGLNIDVESCRSNESKNMFLGFGGEVKELAHKIGVIADIIYTDSKSVETTQVSGIAAINANLQKLSILSQSAEDSVSYALEKVEKLTQLAYTTLDNAANHSQEIQNKIAEIVMSIQFHDIVRQKLEHVISAFDDCIKLLNHDKSEESDKNREDSYINSSTYKDELDSGKKDLDNSKKDLDRRHAKLYFVLKIQSAQLEHIISELNTVNSDLKKAFKGIDDKTELMMDYVASSDSTINKVDKTETTEANKITLNVASNKTQSNRTVINKKTAQFGESAKLGQYAQSGKSSQSGQELKKEFDSIKKELENLKILRNHGQSISVEMMESIKRTSLIVSGLTEHIAKVNSINMNLQYKALNAIIMTSKLGEKGRTLEVLAREVRLISLDSNEFMEQIVKTLEKVKEITGNLKKINEDSSYQLNGVNGDNLATSGISDELSQSLDNTLNQISTTIISYQENIDHSVEMSHKLRQNIEKVRKQVDSVAKWAKDTNIIKEQVDDIVKQIEPIILSMDKSILVEFESIAKRYTMESERKVHHQTSMRSYGDNAHINFDKQNLKHSRKNADNTNSQETQIDNEQDNLNDEFDDNVELF
ncbi:MAG: methyl-accepting chemotaxis protein [Desulfamplus sp.]|nr:methyl-accepting chemotaxis protein [Desulfamplus sp.]